MSAGGIVRVDRVEGNRGGVLGRQQEPDGQQSQTQSSTCVRGNEA